MKKLALFDFDGTVSYQDSFLHFLRFSHGNFQLVLGALLLSPLLARYFLGFLNNHDTKERIYQYYFKHWSNEAFTTTCINYAQQALPNIIRPLALEKIQWHQAQGHRVIVVSASIDRYLQPWCEQHNIELISTQLAFNKPTHNNTLFTGYFSSRNCYGIEKRERIQQYINIKDYEFIYAYGDTRGDKEMLELAHESHYKPFR